MAGYTRQEVYADTDVIEATHSNNEFDQLVAAFNSSTGHKHDGTAAEGPLIGLISDSTQTDKVEIVTGGAKTTGTHQVTGLITADIGVTATTGDITATAGDVVLTVGDVTLAALATVDGRDVSVDGTKLDGIETAATADQIASEVTSTPAGNLVATDVQAALNELDTEKAALAGAAFTGAITTTSTFDGRDVATDGTKLDGIEALAKDDQTAAEVVSTPAGNLIATDVQAALNELDTEKAALAGAAFTGAITTTSTFDGRDVATDGTKLDGIETAATADQTAAEILTAIKTVDGAGSGLDADLLDGSEGSFYRNATNLNAGTVPSARLPLASTTVVGAIETATNAEADGSSASRAITASNLSSLFDRLHAGVGYQKIKTGTIIQWGRTTAVGASSTKVVTFPLAFPTDCKAVTISIESGDQTIAAMHADTVTATSFRANNTNSGSSRNFHWIAIGF